MKVNEINEELPSKVTVDTVGGAIQIFNNVFTKEEAQDLIRIFEEHAADKDCPVELSPASVGYKQEHGGLVRSNLTANVELSPEEYENFPILKEAIDLIRERFASCIRYYSEHFDIPIAYDEGLQLLKYGPGKEYKPHADQGPGHEHRVVSGIIYLNPDEYEGGGTYFLHYDVNLHPQTPSIAVFPSNYAYLHRAKAVLNGTKYALVTWLGSPTIEDLEQGH